MGNVINLSYVLVRLLPFQFLIQVLAVEKLFLYGFALPVRTMSFAPAEVCFQEE